MKTKILILLVALSANICSYSQEKKPYEVKHSGFFVRGTAGLGSLTITESINSSSMGKIDFEINGMSYDFTLKAGYSVIDNLQLYGVFSTNVIPDPTYLINNSEVKTIGSSSVSLSRYGAGATYYLMPENIYASFDVTTGQNEIEISREKSSSQRGLIFTFGLGKEWMVAKKWGIGGALYFFTGSVDDEPYEGQTPQIGNTGFGLVFSVTYN